METPRDGDGPDFDKAAKRLRDKDGLPIGRAQNNSILDSRMHKVEYKDGHKYLLGANTIAENMFAQVDEKGNQHFLFQEIVDHMYDSTEVKEQDAFITVCTGTKSFRETQNGVIVLL